MRVYISADMEGVAGVVTGDQLVPEGFEYAQAREQMTREVLAAVEAVLAAGAEEVVVSDSHGNGQNLVPALLPPQVTLVRSWPRPRGMMSGIEAGEFACAFLMGYHASASNPAGTLAHTMSSRALIELRINGRPASEALLSAAMAGELGCPVALVTGDDVFLEEVSDFLPAAEKVQTKVSCGMFSARCRPPAEVVADIAEHARRAMMRLGEFAPLRLEAPLQVELCLKSRLAVEYASYLPGVTRTGAHTFAFEAADAASLDAQLGFFLNYRPDL